MNDSPFRQREISVILARRLQTRFGRPVTEKLYTLQRVGKIFFHHAGDSDFLTFGRIFKSFFQCGVGLAL